MQLINGKVQMDRLLDRNFSRQARYAFDNTVGPI